ncbi:MAG: T9SS type A sorting domain-containing protein [Bacteroidota bacterium]
MQKNFFLLLFFLFTTLGFSQQPESVLITSCNEDDLNGLYVNEGTVCSSGCFVYQRSDGSSNFVYRNEFFPEWLTWNNGLSCSSIGAVLFTGMTDCDPTSAGVTSPVGCMIAESLPIDLIFFEGRINSDRVVLNWATASETNNEGFEIHRSIDGRNWESIEFINGKGTSHDRHEYSFEDNQFLTNNFIYYRLKQLDFDGNFDYSEVIKLNTVDKENQNYFFPNPTSYDRVFLNYHAKNDGALNIQLLDNSGSSLGIQNHLVTEGTNRIRLNFDEAIRGMVFIKLEQDGYISFHKLVLY